MILFKDAQSIIIEKIRPILDEQRVNLLESIGYVLAHPLKASFDQPPFSNSAMDGFAVAYGDVHEASPSHPIELKVASFQSAGSTFCKLSPKKAIEIATGAPLPEGCDAVIKKEDVMIEHQKIIISRQVKHSENIRRQGEDVQAGHILLDEGQSLLAKHMGMLASAGISELCVYRKPHAFYIATGDEIVELGKDRLSHQVYNSNAISLRALFEKSGCEFQDLGIVKDGCYELMAKIQNALSQKPDLLILTGGVSVGRHDYVKEALGALGAEILFHKVNIKPGKPLLFAKLDNTFIFGLPGNPLSSQVGFYEFILPALRKMRGDKHLFLKEKQAELINEIRSEERHKFVVGFEKDENGKTYVEAFKEGSGNVALFARGNCFISIPPGCKKFKAGERVTIQPYEEGIWN